MLTVMESFAFTFTGLTLGLTMMVIIILVKEWSQHKARQFWPELPSADTLDVEIGLALHNALQDLTQRVQRLEISSGIEEQFSEYCD